MSPQPARKISDEHARDLVQDLHKPEPWIFWSDLVFTATVAWGAFVAAGLLGSLWSLAALAIASAAFYRGLCFIHELTHLKTRALPGFETAWNLLFGAPLLLPSFVYVGVHQDHHKLSTYGTEQDPEYMPFAQSDIRTLVFTLHSILLPVFQVLRFVVISPVALLVPPLHRWVAVHASALSMNVNYKRSISPSLNRSMRLWECLILGLWIPAVAGMYMGVFSWRLLISWYAVTATTSLVNTLRTLGAHNYESSGEPLDRNGQLLDSIDTPGNVFTELWAPVGLRYHALHHYFPGIPYHNLPEAHRRLIQGLPGDASYRATLSPGLRHSLVRLYRRGGQARITGAARGVASQHSADLSRIG
ncbi:MAG TPA: fatty acid desaturase [Bryobacteraceae bacterium]|nr:fatty acid desaturase [Bryobacteraceae bacterium]